MKVDFFDTIEEFILYTFLPHIGYYRDSISPSYLLEPPYRELLMAIARGDGKILSCFRKAKLNEHIGSQLLDELVRLNILTIEYSRERPLKEYTKQKIKKNLHSYKIQSKARFSHPFLRFWFGFIEPFFEKISQEKLESFLYNFHTHYDRSLSLVYEQLSNELLELHFQKNDPLISKGGYWDIHSEFDIVALTKSHKMIIGECKYKGRKICKNELNKLKEKTIQSGLRSDIFALFSKNGFSNELLNTHDDNLLLFDFQSFERL